MFYFAYQDDGDQAFGPTQYRVDEHVFSFKISQGEGDFASLDVQIKNPRVGLLTAARKQWVWMSWLKPDNSVVALFHGRLVGVPDGLNEELVSLTYVGRAADNEQQKEGLADALRVLPYFDPVFIDPQQVRNVDQVLESRAALWHYGRTDKTVSISNIVLGEGDTIVIEAGDVFGLDITYSGEPLRAVNVTAEVSWKQAQSGVVDITAALKAAFAAAGSTGPITSFTGQGLEAAWLLAGDGIGGGWSVKATTLTLLSSFTNGVTPTFVDVPINPALIPPQPPDFLPVDEGDATTNPTKTARFYLWVFNAELSVAYEAERDRSEVVRFTMHADVQDVLSQSDEPRFEDMQFSSGLIGDEIDDANASDGTFTGEDLPIGNVARRSYFNLARGKQSLKFLMLIARARLLFAARAGQVSADIPFDVAVQLSCRHNVLISDARLPGGQAFGKVVGYQFGLDGNTGALSGSVSLGCCIGRGNEVAPLAEGTPTHSSSDYFGPDAQVYLGAEAPVVAGPVGGLKYEEFQMPQVDDGIDFAQMTAAKNVLDLIVVNGEAVQRNVLEAEQPDLQTAVDVLNDSATTVELTLRPVTGGPFRAERGVTISPLVIPRYLDLEASA